MKIIYGDNLSLEQEKLITEISLECGILFDTARLLFYRNIDSVEKAKRFLNPGKKYFFNPFLLKDMHRAVARIKKAKEDNQKVLIFGDYDADGICATVVLCHVLKEYGINPRYFVPEREDGYGLNVDSVKELSQIEKIDLLITVDCGISDYQQINEIKSMGIDVVVTDHHEPPEVLPNCICINPKITGQNCFDGLCGAGVAYKLGVALIGNSANKELDYVALATISDSMDLIDENRDIVFEGLKLFNSSNLREAFKLLINDNTNIINSQTLAFQIAPRINAGGRMGEADTSLQLLMTEEPAKMFELAVRLNALNQERQSNCEIIYRQAKEKIFSEKLYLDSIIMIYDKEWSTGFVGIVAAKLAEEFCRPVIVFAGHDGILKGSSRSSENVNIYQTILSAKDILIDFGGHSQAAGLSVTEENFYKLKERLNKYVNQNYALDFDKKIRCDWKIEKDFSLDFALQIEKLEPFGVGNRKPLFSYQTNIEGVKPLKNGQHFSIKCPIMDMIYFNAKESLEMFLMPNKKTLIFESSVSTYKGKKSLKGYIKGVIPDYSFLEDLKYNFFEALLKGQERNSPKIIDKLPEFRKHGTLYIISDVENLEKYNLPLRLSVFKPENYSFESQIVLAPTSIPDGFDRVVYLDKPLFWLDTNVEVYSMNLNGYQKLDSLDLSRSTFADVFNFLRGLVGKEFNGCAEIYNRENPSYDPYQFIFCTRVFLELGIFYFEEGVFKQNKLIRTELNNSVLFSKVVSMRG